MKKGQRRAFPLIDHLGFLKSHGLLESPFPTWVPRELWGRSVWLRRESRQTGPRAPPPLPVLPLLDLASVSYLAAPGPHGAATCHPGKLT